MAVISVVICEVLAITIVEMFCQKHALFIRPHSPNATNVAM